MQNKPLGTVEFPEPISPKELNVDAIANTTGLQHVSPLGKPEVLFDHGRPVIEFSRNAEGFYTSAHSRFSTQKLANYFALGAERDPQLFGRLAELLELPEESFDITLNGQNGFLGSTEEITTDEWEELFEGITVTVVEPETDLSKKDPRDPDR